MLRKIAARYLRDPATIAIETQTVTVAAVDQRYLDVTERQKLDALTRVALSARGYRFDVTRTSGRDPPEKIRNERKQVLERVACGGQRYDAKW